MSFKKVKKLASPEDASLGSFEFNAMNKSIFQTMHTTLTSTAIQKLTVLEHLMIIIA